MKIINSRKFKKGAGALLLITLLPFSSSKAYASEVTNNYNYTYNFNTYNYYIENNYYDTTSTTKVETTTSTTVDEQKKDKNLKTEKWIPLDDSREIYWSKDKKSYATRAHDYSTWSYKYDTNLDGTHKLTWSLPCKTCDHVYKVVESKKCNFTNWQSGKDYKYNYVRYCLECSGAEFTDDNKIFYFSTPLGLKDQKIKKLKK